MTLDKLLLPPSSSFFAIPVIWGVSGFSYRIFLIVKSSYLSEFSTDLHDFSLKNCFIILGTGLPFYEPIHVVFVFQYFIKRRAIFLRHLVT